MKQKLVLAVLLTMSLVGYAQNKTMTTNNGAPVGDNQNSKTVGDTAPYFLKTFI